MSACIVVGQDGGGDMLKPQPAAHTTTTNTHQKAMNPSRVLVQAMRDRQTDRQTPDTRTNVTGTWAIAELHFLQFDFSPST